MGKCKYKQSIAPANRRRANLRSHPSVRYHPIKVTAKFAAFVDAEIIPKLPLGNRILKKKHDHIQQILANALLADMAGKVLADSRNTGGQARKRIPMYNVLVRSGILRKHTGSQLSGKVTRYDLKSYVLRMFIGFNFLDIVDPQFNEPINNWMAPSLNGMAVRNMLRLVMRKRKSIGSFVMPKRPTSRLMR